VQLPGRQKGMRINDRARTGPGERGRGTCAPLSPTCHPAHAHKANE